jgi:hypothetical protein
MINGIYQLYMINGIWSMVYDQWFAKRKDYFWTKKTPKMKPGERHDKVCRSAEICCLFPRLLGTLTTSRAFTSLVASFGRLKRNDEKLIRSPIHGVSKV